MVDKVIVSNQSALLAKYGKPGFDMIGKALAALVKEDGKRGLETRVIYLRRRPR